MAKLNLGCAITGLAVAGLAGGMVATNPGPEAYGDYAYRTLTEYVSGNLCDNLPPVLGSMLGTSCEDLVQTTQVVTPQMILDRTQRYNLGLFSLYRTTLGLPVEGVLPTYQADTIGVFDRFFTVRVEQIDG
ncbi:DUF4359 domain-containing protein [Nodosilinea sp. P-1105]|uniref:DUF4359 domain-containing protein n=1 Tax=Nodosilinea sp. P-1105 TaxID=2546229 RepID=UPI00146F5233|nr:DUF4359 domain-containing protein [Nodosilinea sp. P-1105]NMF83427.1 DUF4359 domain-containing protein [Nodosilinea sp. P-1105]